jgi:hypothetical protein
MMKWLIPLVTLAGSLLTAAGALADAPSIPMNQPAEEIHLLAPPAMPAPIMIVERDPQPVLDASGVPVRSDRVSYVLPPDAPLSVQSASSAVQATYSPNAPFVGGQPEGGAAPGDIIPVVNGVVPVIVRASAQAKGSANAGYSVAVSICITDPQNQPIPTVNLSLTVRAASGRVLLGTNITTDDSGCYRGTLALGQGVTEVPTTVRGVGPNGGSGDIPVSPP